MGPDRFWIALVDVRPDTPENRDWLASFGDNSGGGFVHVMGMARSSRAFQQAVADSLAEHGWTGASFDDLELLSSLKGKQPLSPAFEEMERALLKTGALQFGRYFLYPQEDAPIPDWLAQEAENRRLTETQSAVLADLSLMLRQLDLPRLDEGLGVTGQGTDVLEVYLPHRDEQAPDLAITVTRDQEITFDYQYGHVHFGPGLGADWVREALEFLYGALQGGVKVQVWAAEDKLLQSRALILLENGEWHPFALWSTTPEPLTDEEPTFEKELSYLDPEGPQDTQKIR